MWVQPGGAEFLTGLGERLGFPDMFETTFELSEYEPDTPFDIGPLVVTPTRVPHYTLQTYAFRVEADERTLAYSGDSAPSSSPLRSVASQTNRSASWAADTSSSHGAESPEYAIVRSSASTRNAYV